jgi:hypothetical protein
VDELDATDVLDDDTWARRQRFWRELVDAVLASVGKSEEWPSWEPKLRPDGTTPYEREYQSICDGRSWRLDRAFCIQERPPTDGKSTISAWVKDYVSDLTGYPDIDDLDEASLWFEQVPAHERVPRSTLVIVLEESKATDAVARSLLEVWLEPATTVHEMERAISRRLGDLG